MIIHDIAQYSEAWWSLRDLKQTASNGQKIGNNGKGLETYALEIVTNHFSTAKVEQIDNEHIRRGNELEGLARDVYSLEKGVEVKEIGMVTNSKISEFASASPDGMIGNNKGIEIKCLMDRKHFEQIVRKEIKVESAYMWQIQMQLLMTGWESIDYVLFNPNFKRSLLIETVLPDEAKHDKLTEGIKRGEELINNYIKSYESRK